MDPTKCIECRLSQALPDWSFCSHFCADTFDSRLNAREPSPARAALTTDAELQAVCRKWQERLRLLDWDVEIRFVSEEMLGENTAGDCGWLEEKRLARIRILQESERNPNDYGEEGVEYTVLHELLHLHLIPFGDEDPAHPHSIRLEQAINAIAKALLTP